MNIFLNSKKQIPEKTASILLHILLSNRNKMTKSAIVADFMNMPVGRTALKLFLKKLDAYANAGRSHLKRIQVNFLAKIFSKVLNFHRILTGLEYPHYQGVITNMLPVLVQIP